MTKDSSEMLRPFKSRSFNSLSEAEEENGQSRIYLGIHWAFDKSAEIAQSRSVADYVYANVFAPRIRPLITRKGTRLELRLRPLTNSARAGQRSR